MISSVESKAFELVCYMVTSACNLLNENKLYGPFRLIDAASRLITLLEEEGVRSKRLEEIRERIIARQYSVMEDEKVFADFLQDLVLDLIPLMKDETV
jgi:hypothetical protein